MSTDPAIATLEPRVRRQSRALEWCLERRYSLAVWASMVTWSTALFVLVRSDFVNFRLARFDLGNMTQAVWSTAHGHPLETTSSAGGQVARLGSHVDPILAVFAPLWLLWPSPLLLAFVQIVAVSLGALPVFWLARRHLGSEGLGYLLALVYLAYPWLAWTAADAMHPVTLAIPLFLFCIWFLDTDRVWAFVPFAVLAALTGELMGLTLAALGIWYAFARGRRRPGIAIAVAGFAWSAFAVEVVIPAFARGSSGAYGNYQSLGGSPEGVIRTAFTDPGAIASALLAPHNLLYLVWLGVPLAGVFLLAPWLAAVALPQLLANGLSDTSSMTDPRLHYIAAIVPFLIAASVLGLVRLRPDRRVPTAAVILTLCAAFGVAAGPWPGALATTRFGGRALTSPAHVAALRNAVSLVPADAAVSSTNRVGSHLSARRYIYTVPTLGRANWIVLDIRNPAMWLRTSRVSVFTHDPKRLRAFARRIEQSSAWHKVYEQDGVLVFRKAPSA